MYIYKKGFTLIELLVVIAIIAVLASVVLPSLNNSRTKGRVVAMKSEMDSFKKSALLYQDDNNESFTGFFDGSANPIATSTASVAAINILASLETKASDLKLYGTVSDNSYSLYARLPGTDPTTLVATDIWCIDSTGKSGNPSADAVNQFDTSDINNIATVCW